MKEIWRGVLDGYYAVSNYGRVRREKPGLGTWVGRLLTPHFRKGYLFVQTCCDRVARHYFIHILVAEAFIGPCPKNKEVNHKDLNKQNNYLTNLEYKTHTQNLAHAKRNGANFHRNQSCEHNSFTHLTREYVSIIRRKYASGKYTQDQLARKFDVARSTITHIVNRRSWAEAA